MYTCAKCNILACGSQDPVVREKMPKNCPMREQEKMNNAFEKICIGRKIMSLCKNVLRLREKVIVSGQD